MVQWYLRKGLEITNISQVIEWPDASPVFEEFARFVSNERRLADSDPAYSVRGHSAKLLGNSAYGRTIVNKERYVRTKYHTLADLGRYNDTEAFLGSQFIGGDHFETSLKTTRIVNDMCIQIGKTVYDYAKLHMLRFKYDFLDAYLDERRYCMTNMDTDSYYLSIAGDHLHEIVVEEKRAEFFRASLDWLVCVYCPEHVQEYADHLPPIPFVRQRCCVEREKYQLRTPGLFKLENRASGQISLTSKTYCLYEAGGATTKVAHKGVSVRLNRFTRDDYSRALFDQEVVLGLNKGFRDLHEHVRGYTVTKKALTCLYVKRKVNDDFVTTTPLDL